MDDLMKEIAERLMKKTKERMDKETRLSYRTLKMISLSNKLFTSIRCWMR